MWECEFGEPYTPPEVGLQVLTKDIGEALLVSARGGTYAQWLQDAFPGIQFSMSAFVKNWASDGAVFNISLTNLTLLGFEHPSFRSLEVPNFVVNVSGGPDTPLDYYGQEIVLLDFLPVRYRGVKGGQ